MWPVFDFDFENTLYLVASAIDLFGLGPEFLQGAGVGHPLGLPLLWTMLAALALNLAALELPRALAEPLRQPGRAAILVALLVLGMQLVVTHVALGW